MAPPTTSRDTVLAIDWTTVPSGTSRGMLWGEVLRRPALCRELGLPDVTSDDALVVAGYQRWGDDLPRHVLGDVSFAVYDARAHELVAFADAAGSHLLVWSHLHDSAAVSGSIRALPRGGIDDRAAKDWLADGTLPADRTLFRGVHRVPPGERIRIGRHRTTSARWWGPPFPGDPSIRTEADFCVAFRERLFEAVRDRMVDRDVVLHLSGGLDSTALALVADELVRTGQLAPRVRTLSFTYRGLGCDERARIERVRRRLALPGDIVEAPVVGLDAESVTADVAASDSPYVRPQRPTEAEAARLARAHGATAVVTGFGGDELLMDPFSPAELVSEFGRSRPWDAIRARRIRAGLPWMTATRQVLAAARHRSGGMPPPSEPIALLPGYPAQARWISWTDGSIQWRRAWATRFDAQAGLTLLCPLYDRRLFELVLGTPAALLPTPDRTTPYKPILARALGSRFPDGFTNTFWKVRFNDYVATVMSRTTLPSGGIPCGVAARWIHPTGVNASGRLTWSPGPRTSMLQTLRVWGLVALLEATG